MVNQIQAKRALVASTPAATPIERLSLMIIILLIQGIPAHLRIARFRGRAFSILPGDHGSLY
jgi:hypothetical protein